MATKMHPASKWLEARCVRVWASRMSISVSTHATPCLQPGFYRPVKMHRAKRSTSHCGPGTQAVLVWFWPVAANLRFFGWATDASVAKSPGCPFHHPDRAVSTWPCTHLRDFKSAPSSPLAPSPSAVMSAASSAFLYIAPSSARSAFRILPRSGSTACNGSSSACSERPASPLADEPALQHSLS